MLFLKLVTKKIPVIWHNGSNYDFHFMIKHLANECEDKKHLMLGWKYWKIYEIFCSAKQKVKLKK